MKGYTLIEVIIALLLLSVILIGGTQLFYQNLRSTGLSDIELNLSTSVRSVLNSIEKDIRFSTVVGVGSGAREDCLSAGASGFAGDSLSVIDLNGYETVYFLDVNAVSSRSAETGTEVKISPSGIVIDSLLFTWYCQSGISDKIKIEIDASSEVLGSGININRSVSKEINLLNSGLN